MLNFYMKKRIQSRVSELTIQAMIKVVTKATVVFEDRKRKIIINNKKTFEQILQENLPLEACKTNYGITDEDGFEYNPKDVIYDIFGSQNTPMLFIRSK